MLGKADLRNDLYKGKTFNVPVSAQILYRLRSSEVVGEGKGQPEGRWEWERDDVRSESCASVFVVIVVTQRLQKKIRAQVCHAGHPVENCSILLTQAKPVPREPLNWK